MLKRKYEKPTLEPKGLLSAVTAAGPASGAVANGSANGSGPLD